MNTRAKNWASVTVAILSIIGYISAAPTDSEKYAYDASGNLVEKKIGDGLTRFNYKGTSLTNNSRGITYLADKAGRMLSESNDSRIARNFTYEYDNKVTRVIECLSTTELFYNAAGQLVQVSTGRLTETFAWDGLVLAMRGEKVATNEEHMAGGAPILTDNKVIVSNPQGSTLSIGNKNIDASAFGEGIEEGSYTGKPYVKQLNGFVFKYRNYNPVTTRWTTPDPSGFPDGENPFMFVKCDPVFYYDPCGLEAYHADYALATATSRPDNNGNNSETSPLSRMISIQIFTKYHHIAAAPGQVGFSMDPSGVSAAYEYIPPTAIYNGAIFEYAIKDGGANYTRFKVPVKAYCVAYNTDENGAPLEASRLNLDGISSKKTAWLIEN